MKETTTLVLSPQSLPEDISPRKKTKSEKKDKIYVIVFFFFFFK